MTSLSKKIDLRDSKPIEARIILYLEEKVNTVRHTFTLTSKFLNFKRVKKYIKKLLQQYIKQLRVNQLRIQGALKMKKEKSSITARK